jgi:hypothetical protein
MGKTTKLFVLTIGRDLYYVAKDYEDAQYEKQSAEEENFMGRKLDIKLTELSMHGDNLVDLDGKELTDEEDVVKLSNGFKYKCKDILNLL